MNKSFQFKCSECGETHEGAPSFSYDSPHPYYGLSEDQKKNLAKKNEDLCTISYKDGQKDQFIRVTLEIPILDYEETFMWGVWVSLSETNFEKYVEHFHDEIQEGTYFGWFQSRLPYYPNTLNLKSSMHLRSGRQRPWLELEHTDHPLAQDYHHGISWEKAIEIAQIAMHQSKAKNA